MKKKRGKKRGKKKQVGEKKKIRNLPLISQPFKPLEICLDDDGKAIMGIIKEFLGENPSINCQTFIEYVSFIVRNQEDPLIQKSRVELIEDLDALFKSAGIPITPNVFLQRLEDDGFYVPLKINKSLEVPPEIRTLPHPISFERTVETGEAFEKEKKQPWEWNDDKLKEIQEKKELKRQKVERRKRLEYEKYVRESAQAKEKGLVKMHAEKKGNLNIEVIINDLSIGNTELLTETEFNIHAGCKYGLVGRNGVGKTTLLRALAEREFEDIPTYLQILHVEQEAEISDLTPLEALLKTDVERCQLLEKEKEILKSGKEEEELSKIYDRLNEIDAYSAPARATGILHGLSFSHEMQETPLKHLSGGWRKRVAIARALFIEPDDEPTNHLDLHAVIWLENFLLDFNKSVVVVSHSKDFLNNVSENIIHFHKKKLKYYKGNYFQFEDTRKKHLSQNQRARVAQDRQRKHIQKFVDRFRAKTFAAKMVQSRLKILKKMEFIPGMVEDEDFQFSFPRPKNKFDGAYLQCNNVDFGYERDKILMSRVNFTLGNNTRIALIGENGVGKSTLVNLMTGELKPLKGGIIRHPMLNVAKFTQHHADKLTLAYTPLEYLKKKFPKLRDAQVRSHLSTLGLKATTHLQPIYTLSGGQKSRVVFAEITLERPNLLLLDEPTNHLDVDTVDALVYAINDFDGPVVIISHDSYLIRRCCDTLYLMENKKLKRFKGDFDKYKNSISIEK